MEIVKYFEMSNSENMTYQMWWDAGKAVLRGKCIALEERLIINALSSNSRTRKRTN